MLMISLPDGRWTRGSNSNQTGWFDVDKGGGEDGDGDGDAVGCRLFLTANTSCTVATNTCVDCVVESRLVVAWVLLVSSIVGLTLGRVH